MSAATRAGGEGVEREVKIAVEDVGAMVTRLRQAGGRERAAPHLERNWVLDREGELRGSGRLLRVREQRGPGGDLQATLVTVKAELPGGDTTGAAGRGVKERLEREVEVGAGCHVVELLELLGYGPVRCYEKVRWTWELDRHEVVLDRTPIGDWVEVEGERPEEVARRLGLDAQQHGELRNYLTLYDAERERNPELPEDMVFVDGPPPMPSGDPR